MSIQSTILKVLGVMIFMLILGVESAAAERLCATVADLHAAFRTARPGDVVLMRDGVWKDADIVFEGAGEPDRPVALRAATPGQVTLTGHSRLRLAGRWLVRRTAIDEGAVRETGIRSVSNFP